MSKRPPAEALTADDFQADTVSVTWSAYPGEAEQMAKEFSGPDRITLELPVELARDLVAFEHAYFKNLPADQEPERRPLSDVEVGGMDRIRAFRGDVELDGVFRLDSSGVIYVGREMSNQKEIAWETGIRKNDLLAALLKQASAETASALLTWMLDLGPGLKQEAGYATVATIGDELAALQGVHSIRSQYPFMSSIPDAPFAPEEMMDCLPRDALIRAVQVGAQQVQAEVLAESILYLKSAFDWEAAREVAELLVERTPQTATRLFQQEPVQKCLGRDWIGEQTRKLLNAPDRAVRRRALRLSAHLENGAQRAAELPHGPSVEPDEGSQTARKTGGR